MNEMRDGHFTGSVLQEDYYKVAGPMAISPPGSVTAPPQTDGLREFQSRFAARFAAERPRETFPLRLPTHAGAVRLRATVASLEGYTTPSERVVERDVVIEPRTLAPLGVVVGVPADAVRLALVREGAQGAVEVPWTALVNEWRMVAVPRPEGAPGGPAEARDAASPARLSDALAASLAAGLATVPVAGTPGALAPQSTFWERHKSKILVGGAVTAAVVGAVLLFGGESGPRENPSCGGDCDCAPCKARRPSGLRRKKGRR